MAETDRSYAGVHYVNYGQIGLWDKADPSAYPLPNGPLPWWGPKGVVVPALDDAEVSVQVNFEPASADDGYRLLTQGEIEVGRKGLTVGNVTTASTADLPCRRGRYTVSCYYRGSSPQQSNALLFALSSSVAEKGAGDP
ncbi:hypothetical protein HGO38_28870 [Rhizobium sp. CG5]|uniref:hypothetical protein n=1 Tax=Rhizobium sp. CG5 TaxID=2726076 RepID=UPI0020339512|nr:hypothetical protein [Rhizobium sp. CG5]MCM2477464.1 hypothetical protein [Rhizobium sp. CG5]